MNKSIFSKYPLVERTYGATFGVIPPGLNGPAKTAAEAIVNNAISSFNAITEGATVTEEALLPVVATMQLASASQLNLISGWFGGSKGGY